MPKKFIRQEAKRHSKLGARRKKLQKWRKPRGIDSKMRQKMKGHLKSPSPGHKAPKKSSGKIKGKSQVLIHNVSDLNKMSNKEIAIIAKVGAKNKLEIIKHAQEKKIQILNVREAKK